MPTIFEITKELTNDNLTDLYLEHRENLLNNINGKFVRIGSLVLIAPSVNCVAVNGKYSGEPQHAYIVEAAASHPTDSDLSIRTLGAQIDSRNSIDEQPINSKYGVSDAGHFGFMSKPSGVQTFSIGSNSLRFGQADPNGRRKTVEIVQSLLPQITVVGH